MTSILSAGNTASPIEIDLNPYCDCRQLASYAPMIQCEYCEDWYHLPCVQLTQAEADAMDKYYCRSCTEDNIRINNNKKKRGRPSAGPITAPAPVAVLTPAPAPARIKSAAKSTALSNNNNNNNNHSNTDDWQSQKYINPKKYSESLDRRINELQQEIIEEFESHIAALSSGTITVAQSQPKTKRKSITGTGAVTGTGSTTTTKSNKKSKSSPAASVSASAAAVIDNNTTGELEETGTYCVCSTADGSKPMIGCDSCGHWFHLDCIHLTQSEADQMDTFQCITCSIEAEEQQIKQIQSELSNYNNNTNTTNNNNNEDNDSEIASIESAESEYR